MSGAARAMLLLGVGCGCAVAAFIGAQACIVAPPLDLPVVSHRPIILHDAVQPSADSFLTEWPDPNIGFVAPVQFFDPDPVYTWAVFVDYDGTQQSPTLLFYPPASPPSALDGGVMLLPFKLDPASTSPPIDLTQCHRIELRVAHDFLPNAQGLRDYHTFDPVGGDSVTWFYVPSGCSGYDAGFLASPLDAQGDSLPLVVEGGPPAGGGDP